MRSALVLARRGLGNVWPNPAVGCVLVSEDPAHRIVGRGWTQPGGRPHAETEALARAGDLARGATAYVTLEPCSHVGQTSPCADALIQAGISRIVIAAMDPDPRVSGRGITRLREAGIATDVGLLGLEAEALNSGFWKRQKAARPLVTLKVATTADGFVASRTRKRQFAASVGTALTSESDRRRTTTLRFATRARSRGGPSQGTPGARSKDLCGNQISDAPRHRRDVVPVIASARWRLISTQAGTGEQYMTDRHRAQVLRGMPSGALARSQPSRRQRAEGSRRLYGLPDVAVREMDTMPVKSA